jgi:UDP-N-acetylglucosamine--N-acetylmuramyl-(pentapeptide) pyrophosphoryl-undecaprenol N-acetylglucosamine transferase
MEMANVHRPEKNPSIAKRKIIIAGGGTGGHIYPGVAIARAAERLYADLEVHFVGAEGGLEEKIIPREKFPLHTVPVGKLHSSVGLFTRIKTLIKLPLALFKAYSILREIEPVVVLGVGGFASGPILFVASLFGYRTLIWEPNAHPGLANRILAGRVDECLLVFSNAGQFLKAKRVTQAGLPVRKAMMPALSVEPMSERSKRPLHVLVFGGSQGARAINNIVCESICAGGEWLNNVEIVHQTGPLDFSRVSEAYHQTPPLVQKSLQVFEYLHDMDQRYAWADVVICRAGASTVAEVCACEKAAVFIPLPTAADNHQEKNAQVLVEAEAAELILQKDLSPQVLQSTITRFRDERWLVEKFEKNVRRFQFPDAAEVIVERLLASSK